MLRPKPGESVLYDLAEKVLAVEAEMISGLPYIAFHLRMPPMYRLLGCGDGVVVVAVHRDRCMEDS